MKRVCTLAEGIIPGFCGTTEFSVNRYGLRGKDVKLDDPELKILIVGGSSAECMYVTDKASWPWLLQEKLCRITGKMVFVGNAGKSGATTFDHVDLLRDYKYAGKFDWVIVLCGVNDMGRLLHNDREYFLRAKHPGAFNKFFHGVYYKNKLFLVLKSCYLNRAALSAFQDKNGLWILEHRNLRKNALKNRTIADLPLNLSFALSIYKYNLNRIIDICFAKQQKILFITQPAMWKNGLTAPFENLLWERVDNDSAYAAGTLSDILNYYNGAIIDICKERGVPFFDLSSMFAKNGSVFYDDCHFNVMGCEIVADLVAKEMANRIEFQTDKT